MYQHNLFQETRQSKLLHVISLKNFCNHHKDRKDNGQADTLHSKCHVEGQLPHGHFVYSLAYILNITLINSYVIYSHNTLQKKAKPMKRREFPKALSLELMKCWMKVRFGMTSLPCPLRNSICEILGGKHVMKCVSTSGTTKRKICAFCPSKMK